MLLMLLFWFGDFLVCFGGGREAKTRLAILCAGGPATGTLRPRSPPPSISCPLPFLHLVPVTSIPTPSDLSPFVSALSLIFPNLPTPALKATWVTAGHCRVTGDSFGTYHPPPTFTPSYTGQRALATPTTLPRRLRVPLAPRSPQPVGSGGHSTAFLLKPCARLQKPHSANSLPTV